MPRPTWQPLASLRGAFFLLLTLLEPVRRLTDLSASFSYAVHIIPDLILDWGWLIGLVGLLWVIWPKNTAFGALREDRQLLLNQIHGLVKDAEYLKALFPYERAFVAPWDTSALRDLKEGLDTKELLIYQWRKALRFHVQDLETFLQNCGGIEQKRFGTPELLKSWRGQKEGADFWVKALEEHENELRRLCRYH